jgi:hypothetical protein
MKIIEDKVYMQCYWDLASENDEQRLKAAYDLIKHLENLNELNNTKGNEGKYQSQKDYLDYSLKRLIRGLGSPRDHARQGFIVAFNELIRVFKVDANTCVELMDDNLQVASCLCFYRLFFLTYFSLSRSLVRRKVPKKEILCLVSYLDMLPL